MTDKPTYNELEKRVEYLESLIHEHYNCAPSFEPNFNTDTGESSDYQPSYGDVTELNTCRVILDSVGKNTLKSIAEDAIDLLGTSVAIYEVNGDYAFGMFSSGWCRLLDDASRKLCRTADNYEALTCGKWLCHESCWKDSAKAAINSGQSTDIQCIGGINLYAEPIYAGEKIVGTINIGYGTPPKDPDKIRELANLFQISREELYRAANAYHPRPQFIIDLAKKRLSLSAKLIGQIVAGAETEQALKKSEQDYRTTLTSMGDAIVTTDLQGRVSLMNPIAENVTGWDLEQAKNKYLSEVLFIKDTDSGEVCTDVVNHVLQGGEIQCPNNYATLIAKEGEEYQISVSASPIRDIHGLDTGSVLVFRDVTQEYISRRLTQIRLELIEFAASHTLNETLTQALDKIGELANSPLGFFHFVHSDQEHLTLTQWSSRTLNEYCRAEGQGLHYPIDQAGVWTDCVPARKPVVHNDYQSLENKKGLPEGHVEVVRELVVPVFRDQKVVAILGVGNKSTDYTQKDQEVVSYLADVTWEIVKRKQAEEELQSSEQKTRAALKELQELIDTISSLLISLDHNWKIYRCNQAAEDILGITAANAQGLFLNHCPVSWDWEKIQNGLEESKNRLEQVRIEDVSYLSSNHVNGFLGLTVHPVLEEDEATLTGFLILGTEITEKKLMESQFLQDQKMDAIGQLAAGIAHEINTPVQYIDGNTNYLKDVFQDILGLIDSYSQLLEQVEHKQVYPSLLAEIKQKQEDLDIDFMREDIPNSLNESLEGLQKVAKIVRSMKNFAHPGEGDKIQVDINKALEDTITICKNEWKYSADVHTEYDPDLPFVPCLKDEINQVFLNLIVNSAQAIAETGSSDGREKGTISVSTCNKSEHVEIIISDTGPGIPEHIRDRIFNPFFTTKEVGKGSGQGLYIAYDIITEKHQGSMDFQSEVGKGTSFFIKLPVNN